MEGQDKMSKRFIHTWYEDDGIFAMRIEDFMETFSQLVVCRDFPAQSFAVEFDCAWAVQKGYAAMLHKNIMQDKRQFIFSVTGTTPVQVTAVLT